MSTEQQWIPLTGPGSRLPSAEDGDEHGNVWFQVPAMTMPDNSHWSYHKRSGAIAFMPIERRAVPPLPKPVEKTQEEKDYELAESVAHALYMGNSSTYRALIYEGIRAGRADGRKALAQETLALFDERTDALFLWEIADKMLTQGKPSTSKALRVLIVLLTEAAKL